MAEWRVASRPRLSGGDRTGVEQLRRACEAAEPLDLKLELDEADAQGRPIHFLAMADREVIAYAGITSGEEAEVCGMVHPGWRRRGIAAELLIELRAAARNLGRDSILVIGEDAGPAALAWMRRLGANLESAERRMAVRLDAKSPGKRTDHWGPDARIDVRPAIDADRDALVSILREGSHETDAHSGNHLRSPGERRLVGVESGTVVGTLRLIESPQRTMIYGFVIDAARRGQRIGTRMLTTVLDELRSDGVAEVGLEVDPDNTPAIRLYGRFGFETVTTYRYMRLASAG